MKKFIIESQFWQVFPKAKLGIVIAKKINNHKNETTSYDQLLLDAENEAKKYFVETEFSQNEVIKVWREAFQLFKTKKGARSSIESLLKRVNNGNHIGSINPLVDIYNSISMKFALPCGGEDIDTFIGDVRLTKALGNEFFVTLGTEENVPPYVDEIVYKDDAGAICRCWNWRESVRTMLTENTQNAFLCIELVDESREAIFQQALNELSRLVQEHLGGEVEVHVLDQLQSHLEIV